MKGPRRGLSAHMPRPDPAWSPAQPAPTRTVSAVSGTFSFPHQAEKWVPHAGAAHSAVSVAMSRSNLGGAYVLLTSYLVRWRCSSAPSTNQASQGAERRPATA